MSKNGLGDLLGKYFDNFVMVPPLSAARCQSATAEGIESAFELIKSEEARNRARSHWEGTVRDIYASLPTADQILPLAPRFLTNIRKLIHFQGIVRKNFMRLQADIFAPDVILMSVIQAGRPTFFQNIRELRRDLTDPFASPHLPLKIRLERNQTVYERIWSPLDDEEKSALSLLFPHASPISERKGSDGSEAERSFKVAERFNRLSDPRIVGLFFHEISSDDYVRKALRDSDREALIAIASDAKVDLDALAKELDSFLALEGPYLELILNWIERSIADHPSGLVAQNLLLALSISSIALPTDEIGFFGAKEQAARSVRTYLQRADAELLALESILRVESSEAFASSIFRDALESTTELPKQTNLQENEQSRLVDLFVQRIDRRRQKAVSVFDIQFSDLPIRLIWSWHVVEQARRSSTQLMPGESLSGFLKRHLSGRIEDFQRFFLEAPLYDRERSTQKYVLSESNIVKLVGNDALKDICRSFSEDAWGRLPTLISECLAAFRAAT